MVEVVAERGFTSASIALVLERAKLSRRAFDELFDRPEDCFVAILDHGLDRAVGLITSACEREDTWWDGVRSGLAALLVFLDSEPSLARVWLVESLAAGSWALQHRERNLAMLCSRILASLPKQDRCSSRPLAAQGAIASVLGIVHTHLVTDAPDPLVKLLGPLMGIIAAPYFDATSVEREIRSSEKLARAIQAGEHLYALPAHPAELLLEIPATLINPNAHRARECLLFVAERPGSNNRQVAIGIGVTHQGQISTLLARLNALGLLVKRAEGAGHATTWRLTPYGERMHSALTRHARVSSVSGDSYV